MEGVCTHVIWGSPADGQQPVVTPRALPAYRSLVSASTLPWSADVAHAQPVDAMMTSPGDHLRTGATDTCLWTQDLLDHIFGQERPSMPMECKNLVKQIQNMDVSSKLQDSNVQAEIQKITEGLASKQKLSMELECIREKTDRSLAKIEKAKMELMARWPPTMVDSKPKIQELERWAHDKIEGAKQPSLEMQQKVLALDTQLDQSVQHLLGLLEEGQSADPEHDELMQELEKKFDAMVLGEDATLIDPPDSVSQETGLLEADPTKNAIDAIRGLPDGPQKAALFAVLEVAATTPTETIEAFFFPLQVCVSYKHVYLLQVICYINMHNNFETRCMLLKPVPICLPQEQQEASPPKDVEAPGGSTGAEPTVDQVAAEALGRKDTTQLEARALGNMSKKYIW